MDDKPLMHLLDFNEHPMVSICGVDAGPLQYIFKDWCRLSTYLNKQEAERFNKNVCNNCLELLPIYLLGNPDAD